MSHSAAVSQKIEKEDSYNPFTSSEQADDEDNIETMEFNTSSSGKSSETETSEKVDAKEFLKGLYTTFNSTGIIPPTVSEEEFCGLTIENLTVKCCEFALSETIERMIFGILNGQTTKKTSKCEFIEIPLKDNNYYFNSDYLKAHEVKPFICLNRHNVLYLMKDNKIFKRLVASVKTFTNGKKDIPRFNDNMVFNKPISYNQIKALTGDIEVRPEGAEGLVFEKDTKTWHWQVSNRNFLKVLRNYPMGDMFVKFKNLYFARDSGKPFSMDGSKYIPYSLVNGKYMILSEVTTKGKKKTVKMSISEKELTGIYKTVVEDFEKNRFKDLM